MKKTIFFAALLVAATFSAYSHDDCEPINSPDKKPLTITVETPGTLSQELADYYKAEIIELTVIGDLDAEDMSMLKNLPNLAILDMENTDLEVLPPVIFQNKTALTSVKLPKTLTTIGHNAFRNCSSLTSVTIPDNVMSIENLAFYKCSSLKSVTIGNRVKEIGFQTFANCSRLTSVTIGNGVTTIEAYAFSDCSSLKIIYCKAETPPSVEARAFDYVNAMLTLYVPIGCKAAYAVANEWRNFKIIETQF